MISFRLDAVVVEELDRLAQEQGLSRSEVLRRALLARFDSKEPPTIRCIRQLWTIHDQLQKIVDGLARDEEDDAAESVVAAVESVADSLEELGEEFEDEDEDD